MPDPIKVAFVEPLKLTDQEHARLAATAHQPDERRAHPRFPAPPSFKILVRFDTGSAATLAVRAPVCNLSVGGVALFHSSFITPGARCVVSMLNTDREAVAIHGVVAHCQFISGRAHVVGVRFDGPIDPRSFLSAPADKSGGASEPSNTGPRALREPPAHAPIDHIIET
jgi:hypothetical protein